MALTQISTAGVKDDAVTSGKIPANAVGSSELADNAVDTAAIANNAVTAGKLASGVQTTINNNADNRVITGSGTANTLNGESTLTWNGTLLDINQSGTVDTGLKLRNSEGGLYVRANDDKTFIDTDQLIIRNEAETERMRIDSSGNIGIGKTPSRTLDVSGKIRSSDSVCFGDNSSTPSEGAAIHRPAASTLGFVTNDTERMRIDSSGNVSIGSTSNVAPLNVKAETDGNLHVRPIGSIASAPAGSGIGLDVLNDAGSAVKDLALRGSTTIFRNASAETMRINSSGNVGIGTSPDSGIKLHVQHDGEANMILEGNVNGQGGFLMLKNNSDNANTTMSIQNLDAGGQGTSEITFQNVSNANNEGFMMFKTRPSGGSMTERMRISADGQVTKPNQPYVMVGRSGNQSVNNTTGTIIAFNSEHYDVGNNFNTSNHRFTAPVDGVYQVNVQVQYNGNINQTHAGVYRNGSNPGTSNTFDAWNNWGDDIRAAVYVHAIYCNAGDYLEGVTYHNNGGARQLEQNRTKMTIYLLG